MQENSSSPAFDTAVPFDEWSVLVLQLPRAYVRSLFLHGAPTLGELLALDDQRLMLIAEVDEPGARRLRERVLALRHWGGGVVRRLSIPKALMTLPVTKAGLSTRAVNVLAAHGCRVMGQLHGVDHDALVSLQGLGIRSADEVLQAIERIVQLPPVELTEAGESQDGTGTLAELTEPAAPTRSSLPDVPEGCWGWTPRSCKALEQATGLFEEMEAETLGELLTAIADHEDWVPGHRHEVAFARLREFLAGIASCAGRGSLMRQGDEFVPPQSEDLSIHREIAACASADEELEVVLRTGGERHRESILRRWTKRAGRFEKLEEIGEDVGVTRERVRQVTERPKLKVQQASLRLPRLSDAIDVLARGQARWTLGQAVNFLAERGLRVSEATLRMAPTLASVGAVPEVDIDTHDHLVVAADASGQEPRDQVPGEAKVVLSRLRLSGWCEDELLPVGGPLESFVLRRLQPGVQRLERVGGAILPAPGLDVSAVRWVVKVLHLMGATPIEALYGRMKRFEEHSYGQRLGIVYPSDEAFEGMLRRDSRFAIDDAVVALRPELDSDDPLTPTERAVIGVLELLGGTATWAEIVEMTVANGHAQSTVALALQGPIVDRLGHGQYGYPGGYNLDQPKNALFGEILTKNDSTGYTPLVANDQADIAASPEPSRSPGHDASANSRRQDETMAAPIPAADRGTLTLPAVALTQDRHRIFLTAIRAEDLQDYTRIDHFKPALTINDPKQGYQRTEDSPRVKKLGNWLRKQLDERRGVLMPTAILASTRDAKLTYDPERRSVTLHKDAKLWVVDGQHRRAGLNYAIHEKGQDDLRSFEVPLVIVEDLSREQEMTQFAVVNGNQKGVRTDLVNMILTQLTSSRGDEAIEERDQWRVVVSRTVDTLNQTAGGPWEGLIVMPNEKSWTAKDIEEDPDREHQRVVRATSFMTSLRPIYDYLNASFFSVEDLSTAQRAERLAAVVSAFWEAIRDLNPDPFAEAGNYVLQKTPGTFALHRLCARIMPAMHNARREWDRENFRIMLEPIGELADPQYWDAKSGEASKYGSMKGFAELADNLMESRKSGI